MSQNESIPPLKLFLSGIWLQRWEKLADSKVYCRKLAKGTWRIRFLRTLWILWGALCVSVCAGVSETGQAFSTKWKPNIRTSSRREILTCLHRNFADRDIQRKEVKVSGHVSGFQGNKGLWLSSEIKASTRAPTEPISLKHSLQKWLQTALQMQGSPD